MNHDACPYCNFDEYDVIYQNDLGAILKESKPLAKGHAIIVPLRHVSSFFDVTEKERKSLNTLLELARNELKIHYQPDGFHIAFNDGAGFEQEADQHLQIHIIPRYKNQKLELDERWGV